MELGRNIQIYPLKVTDPPQMFLFQTLDMLIFVAVIAAVAFWPFEVVVRKAVQNEIEPRLD